MSEAHSGLFYSDPSCKLHLPYRSTLSSTPLL